MKVETTNRETELMIVLPVPGNSSLPGLICKPGPSGLRSSYYQSAVCIFLNTWRPPDLAHEPVYTAGGLLNHMTGKMAGVPWLAEKSVTHPEGSVPDPQSAPQVTLKMAVGMLSEGTETGLTGTETAIGTKTAV